MLITTTRRTLLRRMATGLSLIALSTGTVVALAPAAHAAEPIVTVSRTGSEINILGRTQPDNITLTGSSSTVTVSAGGFPMLAGSGCTLQDLKVSCSNGSTGIKLIVVDTFEGADTVRNQTAVRASLFGGRDNDALTGGSGNDKIIGGLGTADKADGGGGTDSCIAETETSCEQ